VNNKDYPKPDLIKSFKTVCPEFTPLSDMAVSMLLYQATLIKLTPSNSLDIPDPTKIGVYYVLKGQCELVI
jgi:hypothetical protein